MLVNGCKACIPEFIQKQEKPEKKPGFPDTINGFFLMPGLIVQSIQAVIQNTLRDSFLHAGDW